VRGLNLILLSTCTCTYKYPSIQKHQQKETTTASGWFHLYCSILLTLVVWFGRQGRLPLSWFVGRAVCSCWLISVCVSTIAPSATCLNIEKQRVCVTPGVLRYSHGETVSLTPIDDLDGHTLLRLHYLKRQEHDHIWTRSVSNLSKNQHTLQATLVGECCAIAHIPRQCSTPRCRLCLTLCVNV
jgi:hypothetical protein